MQNIRGRGKDLRALFYDELMFMDKDSIEVTLSMAVLDGCMIVGSSSAARDPSAYGMRMIQAKNPLTQRPVFKTLRIGYMSEGAPDDMINRDGELLDPEALYYTETRQAQRIQKAFSRAGPLPSTTRISLPWWRAPPITSKDTMAEYMSRVCERNRRLRSAFLATVPSFHSISALRTMESIMGEDAYEAEMLNMRVRHARKSAFPAPVLLALQAAPVYTRPPQEPLHEHVYVAYDPSGGGHSEACIVSILLSQHPQQRRRGDGFTVRFHAQ